MDKHIPLSTFQHALDKKYVISATDHTEATEQAKSWLNTYKPILLIFGYITAIALIAATRNTGFNWMEGMNVFMGAFFLTLSFFKLLDLKGFAESYAMYDVIAKRMKGWGFIYPFIELMLGLAYITSFEPLLTNWITFLVMAISIIGVLQSVLNGKKIKCACLGAVFNLPMSTVTVIEDALMIVMSGGMIFALT